MARTALIAGNWKLHKDHQEAIHLVSDLGLRLKQLELGAVEVAIHPPFTDLRTVQSLVEGDKLPISLGAQHVSHHERGAFTGEVSVAMLAKLQVRYVLVGHSERRTLYGMDDAVVHATARAVIEAGMVAVICVGESASEREQGDTNEVLSRQVIAALSGLPNNAADAIALAYEPVWAIGSGAAATAGDAQLAAQHLRGVVGSILGTSAANEVRILYGGSVQPTNTEELLSGPDVDGVLVGGASLDAATFSEIAAAAVRCYG
jgi:triosephosphate isomerase